MKTIPHTLRHQTAVLLFISCCIFLLTSCDREPYVRCQSDPTCEYFRCKVNGKWWTPDCEQGPLFGCDHTDVQYYREHRGGNLILITSSKEKATGFAFRMDSLIMPGKTHVYYNGPNIKSIYYDDNLSIDCQVFTILNNSFAKFEVTSIQSDEKLFEGNFSFEAENECNQRVTVTDGEFRLKYRN